VLGPRIYHVRAGDTIFLLPSPLTAVRPWAGLALNGGQGSEQGKRNGKSAENSRESGIAAVLGKWLPESGPRALQRGWAWAVIDA